MDWWAFGNAFLMYLLRAADAFETALLSGTAMGLLLAQGVGTLVIILFFWFWYRVFTRRSRTVDRKVKDLHKKIAASVTSKSAEAEILDAKIANILTYGAETLYAQGDITLEQKDYMYTRIGKAINSASILDFAKASKKEQIKSKITPGSRSYAYKQVKLPAAAPVKKAFTWATGRLRRKAA